MDLNIDRILVAGSIMDRISEMAIPPSAIALAVAGAPTAQSKLPGVQQPVFSLPLDASSPDAILDALATHGVSDAERILPVLVLPAGFSRAETARLRMVLATWLPLEVGTGIMIHANGFDSTDLLLAAGKVGLVPVRLPFSPDDNRRTARWWSMEGRPYSIRQASRDDEGELLALDAACWPPPLCYTATELTSALCSYPQGQLVLETEDGLMATAHCLRVENISVLNGRTQHDLGDLHTDDGSCLVLTAMSSDADAQSFGWGTQLFDFMRVFGASQQSIAQIVAVSFCRSFTTHSEMSFDAYIQSRDGSGALADPILRLHESRGGKIEGVLPGFRPEDLSNERNAVLISYTPAEVLLRMTQRKARSQEQAPHAPGKVHATLAHLIQSVMGATHVSRYNPTYTLQDLGVDSLMLLDLRMRINEAMRCQLDDSFFYGHPTPDDIAHYFCPPSPSP